MSALTDWFAVIDDNQGRIEHITSAQADRIAAVSGLFAAIETNAPALQTFSLGHGVTKSSTPAPKSTGF